MLDQVEAQSQEHPGRRKRSNHLNCLPGDFHRKLAQKCSALDENPDTPARLRGISNCILNSWLQLTPTSSSNILTSALFLVSFTVLCLLFYTPPQKSWFENVLTPPRTAHKSTKTGENPELGPCAAADGSRGSCKVTEQEADLGSRRLRELKRKVGSPCSASPDPTPLSSSYSPGALKHCPLLV